ncbi:protein kinase [Streptomyces sp. CMSTAAHL-2]|uniref:protein kinase n=1 Tax=Streptomyces sp. CMSTAAHL-2 TaxID=2904522 RepID=UPI001E3E32C3|nr:protein kinase [Streptomyces sp. CMSTAAHL-2]MCE3033382.1 protein kinase [Streptomyces sp. CMSTAAHL-2]
MQTESPASEILPLVRDHTGPVTGIHRTPHGHSSDLTAIVECAKGPFFVKAVRNRPGGRRDSLIREREVGAALVPVAPPLLWDVEAEEWLVLGYEAVDGRPADFEPGSADLPLVADLVARIGRVPLPAFARDWTETRWDRFAATGSEAGLFRGDTLLHTDINPSNMLVAGRRVWAVDWAWPTRGAGFIDPALLVVQLVTSGHTPAEAEKWAAQVPAWREAEPEAVDAFAAAGLRMYRERTRRRPAEEWLTAMVRAYEAWTSHRGVGVPPASAGV